MRYSTGLYLLATASLVGANPLDKRQATSTACSTTGCGSLTGIGQISDGQARSHGTNLPVPLITLTLKGGAATDQNGRVCYIVASTGQFQCSTPPIIGADVTTFSFCNGLLAYNGSTSFYQCVTGDNGDNIYTKTGASGCTPITISVGAIGCPASSKAATTTPVVSTATVKTVPVTTTVISSTIVVHTITPAAITVTSQVTAKTVTVTISPAAPAAVTKTVTLSCPAPVTITVTPATSKAAATTTKASTVAPVCTAATVYPNLLIPVNSASPNQVYGTGYNITLTSTIDTLVAFDIGSQYSTCVLNFYLPTNPPFGYSATSNGKIDVYQLASAPNKASTDYANKPARVGQVATISLIKGQTNYGYTFACPKGQTISYELVPESGTSVSIFEDYNPPAIGLVINQC